jgi:transposase
MFFRSKPAGSYRYLQIVHTLYNAETVADVYKALWTVEDLIRTTKSVMDTRPIYHRCNETIRGHVFCSFLALLLKAGLERPMKFAGLKCESAQVIRGLAALQQVEVAFQDKRFVLRSQLTNEASAALRATGVSAPPTLRELS